MFGTTAVAGAAASVGATSSAESASPVTEIAVAEHPVEGVVQATEATGEAALAPIGDGGSGGPIVTFIVRKQSPDGGALDHRGSTGRQTAQRIDNL